MSGSDAATILENLNLLLLFWNYNLIILVEYEIAKFPDLCLFNLSILLVYCSTRIRFNLL